MHRVVVIGCGLFGSAATRYLAEQFDGVLCVGPGEPQDKKAHGGVFGSHYAVSYTHLTLPTIYSV